MWQASSSPFASRPQRQQLAACRSTQSRRRNGDALEVELAGLDLREVEDVVDDRQQRLGRVARPWSRYSRCSAVEVGVEHQLGHADDAVHRRADLVAHVGQELALGAVGRLGRFLGLGRSAARPACGWEMSWMNELNRMSRPCRVGHTATSTGKMCPSRCRARPSWRRRKIVEAPVARNFRMSSRYAGRSSGGMRSVNIRPSISFWTSRTSLRPGGSRS